LLEFARYSFSVDNLLFFVVDPWLRLRRLAPSC
jgi:hypothetical protein